MTFQMDRTSLRIHIQNYISCARITLESIHNGKGEKNRKKEMIKKPTFCEQSWTWVRWANCVCVYVWWSDESKGGKTNTHIHILFSTFKIRPMLAQRERANNFILWCNSSEIQRECFFKNRWESFEKSIRFRLNCVRLLSVEQKIACFCRKKNTKLYYLWTQARWCAQNETWNEKTIKWYYKLSTIL